MFNALVASMLALAAVGGSGVSQVVFELFARSAVEQDDGLRTGTPTAHASIRFCPPNGNKLPPMNARSEAA